MSLTLLDVVHVQKVAVEDRLFAHILELQVAYTRNDLGGPMCTSAPRRTNAIDRIEAADTIHFMVDLLVTIHR
jgi:hypothetical protein